MAPLGLAVCAPLAELSSTKRAYNMLLLGWEFCVPQDPVCLLKLHFAERWLVSVIVLQIYLLGKKEFDLFSIA